MPTFPPDYSSVRAVVSVPNNAFAASLEPPALQGRSGQTETPLPGRAPRTSSQQLKLVILEQASGRSKRDVTTRPSRAFPTDERARAADSSLQDTLARWLVTGKLNANPIPPDASIKPFTDAFGEALREPKVQAWFASKGLDVSTVRIFNDGVDGEVNINGKKVRQRFTTTDGSGWWEVGAKVTEAVNILCPDYAGVLMPDAKTGDFRDVRVMLGFYGVNAPSRPADAAQLGKALEDNGWPPITDDKRAHWREQFVQLLQKNSDRDTRPALASQLQALINAKAEGDQLNLSDEPVLIDPESTLAKISQAPREQFLQWLATPTFQAFIQKIGFGGDDNVYRISNGQLQLRGDNLQWQSLQAYLDDEISKVQANGNAQEKAAIGTLRTEFDQLVEKSQATGNALCSQPIYDARQYLAFSELGTPTTVGQVKSVIGWLGSTLPPSPIGADYAGLTPYTWGPGALSPTDLATLRAQAAGPGSVHSLLRNHTFPSGMPDDDHLKLQHFFDSAQAKTKAQALARLLNMAEVAEGRALSRATRHQLLATAIKTGITADVPGKPGVVAGHQIYRASNLGRTLEEERRDIERHLIGKGADATTAPLIAHLFLAQAAPEFLLKPDPQVPAQAPAALKLSPGQVSIGSTSWLNLRLACALSEKLGGPGSSRALNITQAHALARLNPVIDEQEQLIKSLGAQPVLDWAVMTGVIPKRTDGHYSSEDYRAATQAFVDRETGVGKAFETLTRDTPNQTNLLIKQLALLFPEMTEEEIRDFRLQPMDTAARGHTGVSGPLLTDVILYEQAPPELLHVLVPPLIKVLNNLKDYAFVHPKISWETYSERIKQLPNIASLVEPAVDKHLADARSAHATVIRQMIANAPLDVRRILEVADIQVFSLREATGKTLLDDQYEPEGVAEKIGRQGVLIRYDTKATSPTGGYLEFFPGSMKIIRRDDLRDSLKVYGGQVKERTVARRRESFRDGLPESFDFQAYKSGGDPRPNIKSNVIIEKAGPALPGLGLENWPAPGADYVPNSWASDKTTAIANAILDVTFDQKRTQLIDYANQPTTYHKIRNYPFSSSAVFSNLNARTVLSMIPFVGAIADIAEGKVGAGIKGLLLDFGSFAVTGGVAGAKAFFKGLKVVVPYGGRGFAMRGLKGAPTLVRSVFNPLDSSIDVMKTAQRALAGEFVTAGEGFYMGATAFERCRWGLGVYDTLRATPAASATYPGSRLGVSQQCRLYAVQQGAAWYAIDPLTHKPTGAPLTDFKPDAGTS